MRLSAQWDGREFKIDESSMSERKVTISCGEKAEAKKSRASRKGVGDRLEMREQEGVGGVSLENHKGHFGLSSEIRRMPMKWAEEGNARNQHPLPRAA